MVNSEKFERRFQGEIVIVMVMMVKSMNMNIKMKNRQ